MIKPNYITITGFFLGIIALLMPPLIALILFSLSFLMDILDGFVARKYNLSTNFGGALDSISDKIIEILFIYYLATWLNSPNQAIISSGFSIMISYIKHRTGLKVKSFFDRAQRMIYLLIFAIVFPRNFKLIIITFNILCVFAIIQLLIFYYNKIYKRHISK